MTPYEERLQKLQNETNELIKTVPEEELVKRFFKNFGCINFQGEDFCHELGLARCFHKYHMEKYPALHDLKEYEKYRCYHVTTCKCGYEEACDSSD